MKLSKWRRALTVAIYTVVVYLILAICLIALIALMDHLVDRQ